MMVVFVTSKAHTGYKVKIDIVRIRNVSNSVAGPGSSHRASGQLIEINGLGRFNNPTVVAIASSHIPWVAVPLALHKRQLKKYITLAQQAFQRLIRVFQHLYARIETLFRY